MVVRRSYQAAQLSMSDLVSIAPVHDTWIFWNVNVSLFRYCIFTTSDVEAIKLPEVSLADTHLNHNIRYDIR